MTHTPDGRPLTPSMCTCVVHCANRCEPGHCPEGTPWCACWCHKTQYDAMAAGALVIVSDGETTRVLVPRKP